VEGEQFLAVAATAAQPRDRRQDIHVAQHPNSGTIVAG